MGDQRRAEPPTLAWDDAGKCVRVIDQRRLPHHLVVEELRSVDAVAEAIRDMWVRGAPLIGATAAYGVYFAWRDGIHGDESDIQEAADRLKLARPTAVNLAWAVDCVMERARNAGSGPECAAAALQTAHEIVEAERERSRLIGQHGVSLIEQVADAKRGEPVNILTHCNAGRLACIEYGTATAPIYAAVARGIPVHVWVDETRPRNQGARLTAWELLEAGVDHTIVVDNVGGHLMQRGLVDLVLVGSDRTTRNGDVVNKVGTYLKALAAHDNGVPFYVALPSSSIDWTLSSGADVPIERREDAEVRRITGLDRSGAPSTVDIAPTGSRVSNFAFDVTPARYVTELITERGICKPNAQALGHMFPEAFRQ